MPIRNIFVVLLLTHACPLCASADKPEQQTVLKISRETTRITEPLDDRGFVDYVAAVDQRASRGVTPENNFEVVLRQLLGPAELLGELQEEYHQRLGMPIPKGPFYAEFVPRDKDEEYERAFQGPWKGEDNPRVASWLNKIDDYLEAAREGSRRSRYYMPYISVPAEEGVENAERYPPMISMLLPALGGQRAIARGLRLRVNLRVGEGELDEAWEDVLAIYRISRLSSQGVTLIENLVGVALDGIAFAAAETVLQSPDLTDEQAKRCLADLKRIEHLPSMAEKIDVAERFMGLDAVQFLARENDLLKAFQIIGQLSQVAPSPLQKLPGNGTTLVVFQNQEAAQPELAALKVNWNVVAVMLNEWYDRTVVAASEQDYAKRQQLFKKIEDGMQQMRFRVAIGNGSLPAAFNANTADQNGKLIGEVLVALLVPAIEAATAAQFDAVARLEVLRLAFAAEVYGREHGRYPEQLAKLRPTYMEKIPGDPFSTKPMRVGSSERILVIYSVGRNGKDDLGRDYDDRGEDDTRKWDDVSIRIKLD